MTKIRHAFTLIEILVTVAIIAIMAVIAIPSFEKNQANTEFQNKVEEVRMGLLEMQTKAANPEQGVSRYYATMTTGTGEAGQADFYSSSSKYKSIKMLSGQTLTPSSSVNLVCDKGKNYCCITSGTTACSAPTNNSTFITIRSNSSPVKTATFTIFADPFRVETAITP